MSQTTTAAELRRRVVTPTVLQHEAVECGAAALAMVLHYYKCYISLAQVRIDCGVSRDGSNAGAIAKASNHYGLICKGYRNELESLKKHRLPLIVFWQFYHFLVVEGYDERYFYLNDPAIGRRKLTTEEFSRGFTGVVLTFEPGPDFKGDGEAPDQFSELKDRIWGVREPVLFVLCSSFLLLAPTLLTPAISRIFIDQFLIKNLSQSVHLVMTMIVLILVTQLCLVQLQQRYLLRLRTKLSLSGSLNFMQHLFNLPMKFFAQRFEGSLVQQLAGNERVAALLFGASAGSLLQIFNVVIIALVTFFYDLRLALLTIGLTLLNLVLVYFLLLVRVDAGLKQIMDEYKLKAAAFGAIQSIETFKATGSDFFSRWAGLQAKASTGRKNLRNLLVAQEVVPLSLSGITNIAILFVGSHSVIDGSISLGTLVAFQVLALSFIEPVRQLLGSLANIQEAQGLLMQIADTLRYPIDHRCKIAARQNEEHLRLDGYIELLDLEFGYAPLSPPLIQNFRLSLQPGSRVAIVGASGSGKSTITKLLTGLYKPWSGEILFDGRSIDTISSVELSRSVSVVSQEIFLFEGTVRDNLTLLDPLITETDITNAAKDAEIHDEIAIRSGGYDCHVNGGGTNFSGGQTQRLEIARALVNNPSVVILDEATSALDPIIEAKIYRNLRRRGVTTIIVAHRLSAIRDCDQIIVLDKGKIMQQGTHTELIDEPGPYREMANASQ